MITLWEMLENEKADPAHGRPLDLTRIYMANVMSHGDADRLTKEQELHDTEAREVRHTHATWLLTHGWDMRLVQERLGHANVKTTLEAYGSVMPGRDREAAAAFTDSIYGGDTDE